MAKKDVAALAKEIVALAGQAPPPPPPPTERFGTARNVAAIVLATVTVLGFVAAGIDFWMDVRLAPIERQLQQCCPFSPRQPP